MKLTQKQLRSLVEQTVISEAKVTPEEMIQQFQDAIKLVKRLGAAISDEFRMTVDDARDFNMDDNDGHGPPSSFDFYDNMDELESMAESIDNVLEEIDAGELTSVMRPFRSIKRTISKSSNRPAKKRIDQGLKKKNVSLHTKNRR